MSVLEQTKPNGNSHELKIVKDATCTFCGCVCDDIDLTVKDNHIIEAKRACVLGKAWFLNHHIEDRPSCLIDGQPAIARGGIRTRGADSHRRQVPDRLWPERYAVRSAARGGQHRRLDRRHVDTTTSVCHGPSGMAFQGVGEVTCSLGEVANRGDLIMFWGSQPGRKPPAALHQVQPDAQGHVPAQRPQGPHVRDRRRAQDEESPRRPTSSFRSSRAAISKRCGRCGRWPRASSSTRRRSKRRPASSWPLAGSDGPDEGRPSSA